MELRPLWPEDGTRAQVRFGDATSGDARLLLAFITPLSTDGVLLRSPTILELARDTPSGDSRVKWRARAANPEQCGTTQASACDVALRARSLHAQVSSGVESASQPAVLGRLLRLRTSQRQVTVILLRGGQVPWVDLGCDRGGAPVLNAGGLYIEAVALIEE